MSEETSAPLTRSRMPCSFWVMQVFQPRRCLNQSQARSRKGWEGLLWDCVGWGGEFFEMRSRERVLSFLLAIRRPGLVCHWLQPRAGVDSSGM